MVDKSLVVDLIKMIDEHNVLAKSFRRVRNLSINILKSDFTLRLFIGRYKDPRVYNTLSCDETAPLIVDDFAIMGVGRDIIVKKYFGELRRLHETYTIFIPFQCPIMFLY